MTYSIWKPIVLSVLMTVVSLFLFGFETRAEALIYSAFSDQMGHELVARVNGTPIYYSVFDALWSMDKQISKKNKGCDLNNYEDQLALLNNRNSLLNQLITNVLLLQIASKLEVYIPETIIETDYKKELELAQRLDIINAENDTKIFKTLCQIRIKSRHLYERVKQELKPNFTISPSELSQFLRENVNLVYPHTSIKFRIIKCPSENILLHLVDNHRSGEPIEKSVNSSCSVFEFTQNFVSLIDIHPSFREPALHLKPFEVSDVIRLEDTYAVFEILDRKESIEPIRDQIQEQLMEKKFVTWFDGLKERSSIIVNKTYFPAGDLSGEELSQEFKPIIQEIVVPPHVLLKLSDC